MADFSRLKENWKRKKVLWIFGIVGLVVIAFWPLSSFLFGKEKGLIFFLLLVSLYGICFGVYTIYYALKYKKAMSMGGPPVPRERSGRLLFSYFCLYWNDYILQLYVYCGYY